MQIKGFYLVITLVIFGCQGSKVTKIPPDKMARIMADMTFADQVLNIYEPEDRDSVRIILTESLLKIHNISQSDLDTNLYLYMSDFEKFGPLTDLMLQKYDSLAIRYQN